MFSAIATRGNELANKETDKKREKKREIYLLNIMILDKNTPKNIE